MKTIVSIILLAIALASCNDEQVLYKDIETDYSFSIEAENHREFTAQIVWSVEGESGYTENIKAVGYGSSFDLAKGQAFNVVVNGANRPLLITITKAGDVVTSVYLEAGKPFIFKK